MRARCAALGGAAQGTSRAITVTVTIKTTLEITITITLAVTASISHNSTRNRITSSFSMADLTAVLLRLNFEKSGVLGLVRWAGLAAERGAAPSFFLNRVGVWRGGGVGT